MTNPPPIDVSAVMAGLKSFQQRTARWAFERMYDDQNPSLRFLVADEVGLGKTHVAKGVVALAIDLLHRQGDKRHDIVYVCSNAAIAQQNIRKLVPAGIEPLSAERLTLLPLAQLTGRGEPINLLAITPGTSLRFGRKTGQVRERCLAYTFVAAAWGEETHTATARRLFGGDLQDINARVRDFEREHRDAVAPQIADFERVLREINKRRRANGKPKLKTLFRRLMRDMEGCRHIPEDLGPARAELVAELRRALAIVGVSALQPDLVILDEFQRFKDLLEPPKHDDFAATLAHRLFDHADHQTGRRTRTLLLSATPYRMYTTADEQDGDHYKDFLATCRFLLRDTDAVEELRSDFARLRTSLLTPDAARHAEELCDQIADRLRQVMARTERLASTPDRDGMLSEPPLKVHVTGTDLVAYRRVADLADELAHHNPVEYWKSAPYLLNFMEVYKLKQSFEDASAEGRLGELPIGDGPGLLSWPDIDAYRQIDPQNGRLRWLLSDLDAHRAFELLWIPPSLRYYRAPGSVYDSEEACRFTKRLVFSGWAVVPKALSCLVSYEHERRTAPAGLTYSSPYDKRPGQRLTFRTDVKGRGLADGPRRAAAMTTWLLQWPSAVLAELGDPRRFRDRDLDYQAVLESVRSELDVLLRELPAGNERSTDPRWYWAAPLLLDAARDRDGTDDLLRDEDAEAWAGDRERDDENEDESRDSESRPAAAQRNLRMHLAEARALLRDGGRSLGGHPPELATVLAELAVGGPAICLSRALSAVTGLPVEDDDVRWNALWGADAFRSYMNTAEVTALLERDHAADGGEHGDNDPYWRHVLQHNVRGHLQALLDEHCHVLRDWRGPFDLSDAEGQQLAAEAITDAIADALRARSATFRVDIPTRDAAGHAELQPVRMRSRFAVAFGNQRLEGGGEQRIDTVSKAFNSPFWPFVLASTSVGQEGLDFHLWSHAVVHWNLPANPVDLEQREGRVHRFKGHAVRRNLAETVTPIANGSGDLWQQLFETAAERTPDDDLQPYWIHPAGDHKILRLVPILPFSREHARLPQLRKALATYRLAFGQPRQQELVELLGAGRSPEELQRLSEKLRIDLTPPAFS